MGYGQLLKRGWQHEDECCLCDQTLETSFQLALECPFARQVWHELIDPLLLPAPGNITSVRAWWEICRKYRARKDHYRWRLMCFEIFRTSGIEEF
jgi:hypothetical protein